MGTLTSVVGAFTSSQQRLLRSRGSKPWDCRDPGRLGAPTSGLSCKNGVVTPVSLGEPGAWHTVGAQGPVSLGKPNKRPC